MSFQSGRSIVGNHYGRLCDKSNIVVVDERLFNNLFSDDVDNNAHNIHMESKEVMLQDVTIYFGANYNYNNHDVNILEDYQYDSIDIEGPNSDTEGKMNTKIWKYMKENISEFNIQ